MSLRLKLLVTVNYSSSNSKMNEDNLANDYFPDPPTPINNAFPTPNSKILTILAMCCIAYLNRTKFITLFISLYSANFSSNTFFSSAKSLHITYALSEPKC